MDSGKMSVRLDAETERHLREEARTAGKNESELVQEALAAYFGGRREEMSAFVLAQEVGVIGCANGLPPFPAIRRQMPRPRLANASVRQFDHLATCPGGERYKNGGR